MMVSNGDDRYNEDIIGLAGLANPAPDATRHVVLVLEGDVPGIVVVFVAFFTSASVRMGAMLKLEKLAFRLSEKIPRSVMSDFLRPALIQSRSSKERKVMFL